MDAVSIVIPIWKSDLSEYERISLLQACRVFQQRQIVIITHRQLDISAITSLFEKENTKYQVQFFHARYFANVEAYSSLLVSMGFYLRFLRFNYILIYQLDCFAFYDNLDYWMSLGYSYIGAPWFEGYENATPESAITGVGNGGLSLRHVKSHIRALTSFGYINNPITKIVERRGVRTWLLPFLFVKYFIFSNNLFFLFNDSGKNEDFFWCNVVGRRFSWFSIPNWQVASMFSIEVNPEVLLRLNSYKLPFGCHAWWRYNLEVLRPYIEQYGYKL